MDLNLELSQHFTLREMLKSASAARKGIANIPGDKELDALYTTAAGLERVRSVLGGVRMYISSGYRSPKLNTAVGGAHVGRLSQHCKGEAADFEAPDFGSPLDICLEIMANADFIGFDQLIWEGDWVHISFSDNPRCEVLTAKFINGEPHYSHGIKA